MALCTESPLFADGGGSWRLRDVSWRRVLAQQDYGSILASLVAIAALAITQGVLGGPTSRPFMVTDATISFPTGDSSVPYWLDCLVASLMMFLSILAAELWLGRRLRADLTDALAAVLHFTVDGLCAFVVTGMATAVAKMVVGRLRPDFLDRCQPAIPNPVTVKYGLPAADNPVCTVPPSGELTDGHYSFPSGHTSTAFVFAIWSTAFCVWAFYARLPAVSGKQAGGRGLGERLLSALGTAVGFLWILGLQAWAWYVGISRITDFKHHPSDVVAGAFMGGLFGVTFCLRAIFRVGCVVSASPAEAAAAFAACGASPGAAGSAASDGTPEPAASLLYTSNRVAAV